MKSNRSFIQWAGLVSFSALILQPFSEYAQPVPAQAANRPPAGITCQKGPSGDGNMAIGEWQAEWLQWAVSLPADASPFLDNTGQNAGIGQHGPVWFLAGNFGGSVNRTNAVPAGKWLFFPILNQFWIGFRGDPPWHQRFTDPATGTNYRSYETYVRQAVLKPMMDAATDLLCEIDGKAVRHLEKYRSQSPTFEVWLPKDNVFGVDNDLYSYGGNVYQPCADDGIYLMLAPLAPGQHTIHFTAQTGTFALDVTYYLTVTPGDAR